MALINIYPLNCTSFIENKLFTGDNSEGQQHPSERQRHRWEGNIKTGLTGTGNEEMS